MSKHLSVRKAHLWPHVIKCIPSVTLKKNTHYSAELTQHSSVGPGHRLGWRQRGLFGGLRGGGWDCRWRLLSGHTRRGGGSNRFGGCSRGGGGRAVLSGGVVGWGARRTLAARFRSGGHQPLWRYDRLFRWQRFTKRVPQGFRVRDKMAVWLYEYTTKKSWFHLNNLKHTVIHLLRIEKFH